jgi:cardiolipin synthase
LEALLNSSTEKKIQHSNTKLKIKQNIPNIITILRLVVLPYLVYSFNHQLTIAAFILFLFSISTDIIDGYVARKLGFASKLGAYLDVTVDFLFIIVMYLTFSFKEIYSPWVLIIIVFVFTQFFVSNIILKRTIYDPIGKYFGSILFGGIGLTILFSDQLIYTLVTTLIVIAALASLLSRFIFLLHQKKET